MKRSNFILSGLVRLLVLPTTIILIFLLLRFEVITKDTASWILGLSVITWIIFIIGETLWLHKKKETFKRNVNFNIFILYMLLVWSGYGFVIHDEYMYTDESPCGNYKVDVYSEPMVFNILGERKGAEQRAKIVLLNKSGWTIGKSREECDVTYNDVKIQWDYDKSYVWYAKNRRIDLKTGLCGKQ